MVGVGSVGALVEGLEEVLEVGEDVGVWFVAVLGDELAVNADVEFTVAAGDEGEGGDAVADAVEGVAGHPGGAEGMASVVAVFDFYGVFFEVGHGGGSFGGVDGIGKGVVRQGLTVIKFHLHLRELVNRSR